MRSFLPSGMTVPRQGGCHAQDFAKAPHWGDWEGHETSTEFLRMSNRASGHRWST